MPCSHKNKKRSLGVLLVSPHRPPTQTRCQLAGCRVAYKYGASDAADLEEVSFTDTKSNLFFLLFLSLFKGCICMCHHVFTQDLISAS